MLKGQLIIDRQHHLYLLGGAAAVSTSSRGQNLFASIVLCDQLPVLPDRKLETVDRWHEPQEAMQLLWLTIQIQA